MPETETFDYVIVGAGSSGALIASRLAEKSDASICLLEAGPKDSHPLISVPAGFLKVIFDPKLTWSFQTEPSDTIKGRSVPAIQGRVIGGSSAINGMVYTRGQHADFDHWAQLGNKGWRYQDVLPYFRRTESWSGHPSEHRGYDGKIPIRNLEVKNELVDGFLNAAQACGIPFNPDYNGADQAGAGVYQYNIGNGRRKNTARTYLKTAARRQTLDIRTQAYVTRVLIEQGRATGVDYCGPKGETTRTVLAKREVIVCAGALNTPRLLQISGIGNPGHLKSIGVDVQHALAGVGENLRDHFTPRYVLRVKGAESLNDYAKGFRLIRQGVSWLVNKPSIISTGPVLAHAFWKSREGLANPDILVTFTPGSFKEGFLGVLDDVPGMTLGSWQLRPESQGYVKARSPDIFTAPEIQPNYLADEMDRYCLVAGQKLIRRILGQPDMARYIDAEIIPGDDVRSDDEMLDYAKTQGLSGYHYCGTCKMGPGTDPGAVVDNQLRVHGLTGLRIGDASIMPTIPSGNTNAPTMMIAEKASELILSA